MRLIDQSFEILYITPDALELIERVGRTCYKSQDKITKGSAEKFVKGLIKRQHTAMIEFADIVVRMITDRSVTHELVRHRLCSFAQESQRYVNYEKDDHINFILPPWLDKKYINTEHTFESLTYQDINTAEIHYFSTLLQCEFGYKALIKSGWKPEQARKVLPNSVATEIVIKANFREWQHIFNLRAIGTTGRPDPTIQILIQGILDELDHRYPGVFRKD